MGAIKPCEAALDAFTTMCDFLNLDRENQTFTEADRDSIKCDLRRLAQCIGQMDAGQRGRGVDFDEIPFILTRIAVACMHMEMSGALDRLEVEA